MTFTPRRAPDEQRFETERIMRQVALLQVKLAGVALELRKQRVDDSGNIADDLDGLSEALSGFRKAAEHESQQQSALSQEAQKALFEVGKSVCSTLDLQTVLDNIIDSVIELTKAERGYVVMLDDSLEQTVKVARNRDRDSIQSMEFAYSSAVVTEVLKTGKSVLTSNAQTDDRFSRRRSVIMFRLTSIMAAPLVIRGKTVGVVYVDNRAFAGQFTPHKLELLEAFASQAAIAIHNAQLYGQTDEALKQRVQELEGVHRELEISREKAEKGLAAIEREMQMGRVLQSEFLPRNLPSVSGWQIACRFMPARHLSGDFYDVYSLPSGEFAFALADVCDKGVGAALFMSLVRGLLRNYALHAQTADELLKCIPQTNDYLARNHGHSGMFTTLFFGIIDTETGRMQYINCGQDAPIIIAPSGAEMRLECTGPALGAIPNLDFDFGSVVLLPGDTFIAFTDGVTDALDPRERQFGEEPFLDIVRRGSSSVTAMLGNIEAAVKRHIGTAAQYDDITLFAIRRNPMHREDTTGRHNITLSHAVLAEALKKTYISEK
ncbi:MAG TPA: SpoIIE family protein phosphatase [Polyangium sp.]|jgi:sigma-B regulation protein RsbU (phosphoserine phosphatase)|nr:SpoIIE family protein phosphatase [Polyangium sp.]